MFGICVLSVIPLRAAASDRSEMVSQILLGDHFEVLDNDRNWILVRMAFDQYSGWIDRKQMNEISKEIFDQISLQTPKVTADLVDLITTENQFYRSILLGSSVNFVAFTELKFSFEGNILEGQKPKNSIVDHAFLYQNSPYLWGGRTPFGIDCSGFTQMAYKLSGYALLRDASQQATQGESLSFIEESEPGDLAFFDNEEGQITHVGIILQDNYIIHACGQVRVDRLDHLGIYNEQTRKHSHKLRVIKKII